MNHKTKWEETLEVIKKNEELFTEKVEKGSDNPMDYHYMSYFSGLHNGFKFCWLMLDGQVSEKEFDEQLIRLLQIAEEKNLV